MTDPAKLDSDFEPVAAVMPFRIDPPEDGVVCPSCGVDQSPGFMVSPTSRIPLMCGDCFESSAEIAAKQSAGDGWNVQRPPPIDKKKFVAAFNSVCEFKGKKPNSAAAEGMWLELNGSITTQQAIEGLKRAVARHDFFPTAKQVRDAGRVKL